MSDDGAGCALVFFGLLAFGLYHEHSKNTDLREKLEEANSEIVNLKEKTTALTSASDDMHTQLERFETESWQDVVPDAKRADDELQSTKDEAEEAAQSASEQDPDEK